MQNLTYLLFSGRLKYACKYQQRKNVIKLQKSKFNPKVFYPSVFTILLITAFQALAPKFATEVFKGMQGFIAQNFGWFYVLAVAVILIKRARYSWVRITLSPSTKISLGFRCSLPQAWVSGSCFSALANRLCTI